MCISNDHRHTQSLWQSLLAASTQSVLVSQAYIEHPNNSDLLSRMLNPLFQCTASSELWDILAPLSMSTVTRRAKPDYVDTHRPYIESLFTEVLYLDLEGGR
jgi:hypothetical protein